MSPLLTHRRSREALAIGLFIGAVFYGDIFLGITVPAAVLLLPIILLLRIPTLARNRPRVPIGLILLSCTAVSVVIQTLSGYGPRGKTDLVIYLPFVYAALTMLTLAGSRVTDRHLHRSLLAGGVLCAVLLILTVLFAGPSFYFLPGQNPFLVPEKEKAVRAMLERESRERGRTRRSPQEAAAKLQTAIDALPADKRAALEYLNARVLEDRIVTPQEAKALRDFAKFNGLDISALEPEQEQPVTETGPGVPLSTEMQVFYDLKNRARTPLGMSNYLAVMFVFLFNVMLYQRSRWAILFAAVVLVTMSRTGVGFLLVSIAFWIAYKFGRLRQLAVVTAVGACACVLVGGLMWDKVRVLPGAESLASRAWYLDTAGEPIATHPIAGTPRSEVMRLFGYPLTWNPHSSVLHLLVLFGILGTVAYAAYLGVVLRALARRARESALWRGITAGTVVMLLWSLVEIIVLSPAFELLIAGLYSLAYAGTPPAPAGPSVDGLRIPTGRSHGSDLPATPGGGPGTPVFLHPFA